MSWRWRSGAVLALVTACSSALTFLALRPASDGSTHATTSLVAGAFLLVAALWPLAARSTSVLAVTSVLTSAQIASHALVTLGTGAVDGPRQLVCCPSAAQVRPGLLGELTAQAGWALFGVQVLACLLLAVAQCWGRRIVDDTAQAFRLLAPLVRWVLALPSADLPTPARRLVVVDRDDLPRKQVVRRAGRLRRGPPGPVVTAVQT